MASESAILPVVCLMGPTASGKTDVAAELSKRIDLEIISVDAAQVYRKMNIGTAKPDTEFLRKYPHHLIDIRDPESSYSAAEFVSDCRLLIDEIRGRQKIPLLVGGTMFYFHALEQGLSVLPASDKEVRKKIEKEFLQSGAAGMHKQLQQIDPLMAQRIKPKDRQRLQRALEIFHQSGKPPSEVMGGAQGLPEPLIKLTLFEPDRRLLHRRIEKRFDHMLDQGLVDEVKRVSSLFSDPQSAPSMRIVGYRQVLTYLKGETGFDVMRMQGIAATRQLAKRQLTWLRQNSNLVWFVGDRSVVQSLDRYLAAHPLMQF